MDGKPGFIPGLHLSKAQIKALQQKAKRRPARSLRSRVEAGDATALLAAVEKIQDRKASLTQRLMLLDALGNVTDAVPQKVRERIASALLDLAEANRDSLELRTKALWVFEPGVFWSKRLETRLKKLVVDERLPIDVRHTAFGVCELHGTKVFAKRLRAAFNATLKPQ